MLPLSGAPVVRLLGDHVEHAGGVLDSPGIVADPRRDRSHDVLGCHTAEDRLRLPRASVPGSNSDEETVAELHRPGDGVVANHTVIVDPADASFDDDAVVVERLIVRRPRPGRGCWRGCPVRIGRSLSLPSTTDAGSHSSRRASMDGCTSSPSWSAEPSSTTENTRRASRSLSGMSICVRDARSMRRRP